MSKLHEIREVYLEDINKKSKMIKSVGETLGEIQGERKIWVDMEFVEKWAKEIARENYLTDELLDCIKRMLREAGISIKK